MPVQATLVLGFIGVIAAMVCIYVLIMPEGKYRTLNPFCRWLSDLFNFRSLWLESIIKFFYILSTVACVIFGFFMLFSVVDYYYGSSSLALPGLLLLVVGPVVVRLVYEGTMMFIILVKNTMQINNRLRNNMSEKQEEVQEAPAQPVIEYCEKCGKQIEDDVIFCSNCGNKVR